MKIGDKVVIADDKTKSVHTITDKMFSEKDDCYYFELDDDKLLKESEVNPYYEDKSAYSIEVQFLNEVTMVILWKTIDGEKIEICRGHGHTIHEGELGIVQSASYAMKKMYVKLGGTF